MNASFARTDTSVLARWWWTVDRWTLAALAVIVAFGVVLVFAASPPAASRMGLEEFHFVRQHLIYLPPALVLMLGVSLLPPRWIRRAAVIVFLMALAATAATLVDGAEYKGARRWLSLAGVSLQPSEFLKPSFAVFAAWMFSLRRLGAGFRGDWVATGAFFLVAALLLAQPDLGMAVVMASIWFAEFFLAGLSASWVALIAGAGIACVVVAYHAIPHVAQRIDLFLDPAAGDSYQIDTALAAFGRGGLFGRGPGEGTVKAALPDAHSDFVFAVAGEEFGLAACLVIVGLYAFVVLRGLGRMLAENDFFVLLAVVGLLTAFGVQAIINMGSSLALLPTKGMTLPLISYGGSSAMALGLGMGMVLGLTRRRVGAAGLS